MRRKELLKHRFGQAYGTLRSPIETVTAESVSDHAGSSVLLDVTCTRDSLVSRHDRTLLALSLNRFFVPIN